MYHYKWVRRNGILTSKQAQWGQIITQTHICTDSNRQYIYLQIACRHYWYRGAAGRRRRCWSLKTIFSLTKHFLSLFLQTYASFVKSKNRLRRHQIASMVHLYAGILIPRLNRCRSPQNRRRRCCCRHPCNSGARCCARSCTPLDSCESSSTSASSSV